GFGSVWIVSREGGEVMRIDPAKSKVVATIPVGNLLYGLAVTPDGVWATAQLENTVVRVDPKTNKVVDTIHDPVDQPFTFAATPGALWISHANGIVSELDTKTDTFVAKVKAGGAGQPGDPDSAAGVVWYPDGVSGDLVRIDPKTAKVTARVPLGTGFSVAQA